jgi:hypothetical protein
MDARDGRDGVFQKFPNTYDMLAQWLEPLAQLDAYRSHHHVDKLY